MPALRTFFKVREKCVRFSFGKCSDSLEVPKRRLHKPCIECIEVLSDLNFRADDYVIESKLAELAWKVSYDEPISKFSAGEFAETTAKAYQFLTWWRIPPLMRMWITCGPTRMRSQRRSQPPRKEAQYRVLRIRRQRSCLSPTRRTVLDTTSGHTG